MADIIRAYRAARRIAPKNKKAAAKIKRGRSRSISSEAEDLLAFYLVENCRCIDRIRIDQAVSLPKEGDEPRNPTFYPDIMIVRDNRIDAMIDVKTDIGWARGKLPDVARKHFRTAMRAQGRPCVLTDGEDKSRESFTFAEDVTYDIVLISAKNLGSKSLGSDPLKGFAQRATTELFVLSSGEHPNAYRGSVDEVVRDITVHEDAFAALTSRVCRPRRSILGRMFGQAETI